MCEIKINKEYKVCRKCNETLPIDCFKENPKLKSGYNGSCRFCSNTYVKKLPPSDVVDGHKMCLKCNELLPVNKFRENLTVKSGLHSYCIDCTTVLKKVREPKVVIPKKVREPKVIIPKVKKVRPPRIVDGKCVCSTCKELLPVDNFYVDKKKKGGIMYLCKVCKLSQNKKSRELHKYDYSEYRRQYKKERGIKDRIIREQEKLIKKQEKEKELELLKIQKQNIRLENLENKRLEKIRITEEKRLERIRIKEEYLQSEEYQEHQRLLKDRQRLSVMRKFNRRMEEPLFKFKKLLRNNIRNSFKRGGFSKTSQACEILGADWDDVKKYFESKFKPGMTWENMGLWHIDHILPISMATCEEDVIRLNHYTNLQPLWADDNIKKSDKLTTEGYFKQKFPYNEITSDDEVNLVEVKIDDNRGLGFFRLVVYLLI
jgi:hypothetical protein